MSPATVSVPLAVRVAMAHAAAQSVASSAGIDILHIKGPALDESLVWEGREGTDADILVPESEASAMVSALAQAGWVMRSRFENSSAFQHSATLWHQYWGHIDVHRYFPGITADPDRAFDKLWEDRSTATIAGVTCPVPSLAGQVLIVALHAARSGGSPRADRDMSMAWGNAPVQLRDEVLELVDQLAAHVGFAAATGHLDDFKGAREYDLWVVASRGGTRFQEWKARVKAAPSGRAALATAARAALVNTDHLAMLRGHQPTLGEIVLEFFARPVHGVKDSWRKRRRRQSEGGR